MLGQSKNDRMLLSLDTVAFIWAREIVGDRLGYHLNSYIFVAMKFPVDLVAVEIS